MEPWLVTLLLFGGLILGLVLGLPIAFTLAGLGIGFTLLLWGSHGLLMISSTFYAQGSNFILVAVPLFILMANFLKVSGIADDLYNMASRWIGGIPGGLASGTIIACAIFAAMAGTSSAATVTMGLIAIPSMLKRGYDKKLVAGCVSAGGALGVLIPPSVIAIIYGAITGTSVGKLFMGSMIPGIILAGIFVIYITGRCLIQPALGQPVDEKFSWAEKIRSLKGVIFPLILIILVLGTIYTGICTPTEASGIGAIGALICCAIRHSLTWQNVKGALMSTLSITSMVIWIIGGAICFTHIYTAGGAQKLISSLMLELAIPPLAIIMVMQFVWIILGMFLDPAGMCMITAPVFVPIVASLGFDPVWFGVLFIVNTEMAFLTPPFGFNLFFLKSVVPPEITMRDIYLSIIPFVFCQLLCLLLVMFIPQLTLWLPSLMVTR